MINQRRGVNDRKKKEKKLLTHFKTKLVPLARNMQYDKEGGRGKIEKLRSTENAPPPDRAERGEKKQSPYDLPLHSVKIGIKFG